MFTLIFALAIIALAIVATSNWSAQAAPLIPAGVNSQMFPSQWMRVGDQAIAPARLVPISPLCNSDDLAACRDAATHGDVMSQRDLGRLYSKGKHVTEGISRSNEMVAVSVGVKGTQRLNLA